MESKIPIPGIVQAAPPKGAEIPREVDFSAVTFEDLHGLGIYRRRLAFNPTVAKNLVNQFKPDDEPIMADLYSRVKKICERVNTNRGAGSRMIIEAVLLAAAQVSSDSKRNVVIVPEMTIFPVYITGPYGGYKLFLSGSADYVVVEHEDADAMNNRERLLDPNVSSKDIADISQHCFFVTVAKCLDRSLASYIPEAVSQSVAWLKSVDDDFDDELNRAYFCVTNGKEWMFCQLLLEDDEGQYFESTIHRLTIEELQYSDKSLREIVQLIRQWAREEQDLKDFYECQ